MPETKFKNNKLRGRIVEKFGTISKFAEAVGKSRSTISLMLSDRVGMDRKDIGAFCSVLDIKTEEIPDYFFTQ